MQSLKKIHAWAQMKVPLLYFHPRLLNHMGQHIRFQYLLPMLMYLETVNFVPTPLLYPYFGFKSSEGSGKSELSSLDRGTRTQISNAGTLLLKQK